MFRCQMCKTIVPAGVPTSRIVVATRSKVYASRGSDPTERGGPRFRRGRPVRKRKPYDRGGEGTEIVREVAVCPKCASQLTLETATPEAPTVGAVTPVVITPAPAESAVEDV